MTRASLEIGRFLSAKGIKMLVIACNSASSMALDALEADLDFPVIGVIEPGASAAVKATRVGRIGVIGTQATISSGAYEEALKRLNSRLQLVSKACPLFVPLVEEGWWNNEIARMVVKAYLDSFRGGGIDTLILGCTHYPLLKTAIRRVMGRKISLVDSADSTALEVERVLISKGMVNDGWRCGIEEHQFWVSDHPERFAALAKSLLGIGVDKVHTKRFEYLM